MKVRFQKMFAAIAVLVILAITQTYIAVSYAGPASKSGTSYSSEVPPQLMGVLTTAGDKPITVNGASAVSGASIPSGASIETPGYGATIRLGPLGSICIAPNTKFTLTFDQQGNIVNVTLTEGCIILRTPKNVAGAINSPQGTIGKIDGATGGSLDVCLKPGAPPSVNQGEAANAGAGASALDCGAAGAAAIPPGGLPPAAIATFIGGGTVALWLLFRGGNPSPGI